MDLRHNLYNIDERQCCDNQFHPKIINCMNSRAYNVVSFVSLLVSIFLGFFSGRVQIFVCVKHSIFCVLGYVSEFSYSYFIIDCMEWMQYIFLCSWKKIQEYFFYVFLYFTGTTLISHFSQTFFRPFDE